jgi:protein TonB
MEVDVLAADMAVDTLGEPAPLVSEDGSLSRRLRKIWFLGALGALVIHASAAAVVVHYTLADNSDDLGAPGVEVSLDLAAPHVEPSDLPLGPNTDATAASPLMVEQKAVVTETDLPKATPDDNPDPDRIVSPVDAKKPVKDKEKTPTAQAQASEQSVATEATAMTSVEGAIEAPKTTAPSLGTGTSTVRQRVTWEKELAAHFDKFKRYPAERAEKAAQVVVSFVLDRMGHIVSSRIEKGSGDPAFDDAALKMLQKADPVPEPPPLVVDHGLSFSLPVIFHVTPPKK